MYQHRGHRHNRTSKLSTNLLITTCLQWGFQILKIKGASLTSTHASTVNDCLNGLLKGLARTNMRDHLTRNTDHMTSSNQPVLIRQLNLIPTNKELWCLCINLKSSFTRKPFVDKLLAASFIFHLKLYGLFAEQNKWLNTWSYYYLTF